jgi:hypothetical protein
LQIFLKPVFRASASEAGQLSVLSVFANDKRQGWNGKRPRLLPEFGGLEGIGRLE